jgi:hypothetical protein
MECFFKVFFQIGPISLTRRWSTLELSLDSQSTMRSS